MDYQPKATLCAACKRQDRDCSNLPFHAYSAYRILPEVGENGTVVVVCAQFERCDCPHHQQKSQEAVWLPTE